MDINVNIVAVNRWNRPGKKLDTVLAVVVHWTASPRASANNIAAYFHRVASGLEGRYAGAHYAIGTRGEMVQCFPADEVTYHCGAKSYTATKRLILGSGNPNHKTIGIELCHSDWSGEFEPATLNSAVQLTAMLCSQHQLNPQKQILRHFDVTGKDCPKWFVAHDDDWRKFCQQVEGFING